METLAATKDLNDLTCEQLKQIGDERGLGITAGRMKKSNMIIVLSETWKKARREAKNKNKKKPKRKPKQVLRQ